MLSHITLAILTFVVTNMDDMLILSIYFASPKYKTRNIVAGQYLGIITLIAIGLVGIVLGEFLDKKWISLLGIFPMLLGIKDLWALRKSKDHEAEELQSNKSKFQLLSVALVTIANGGDNIGVYTPLFANISVEYVPLYILIFLILTALWCALGYWFVSHQKVKNVFSTYGRIILPFFLIALGLFILKDFFFST